MWMKLTHKSKGTILINSDRVLYVREIDDGYGGKDCEAYLSFEDFIVVDEDRAEFERQLGASGPAELKA
jgi:hypothetical protein